MRRILIAAALLVSCFTTARGGDDLKPFEPVRFTATGYDGYSHDYSAYWVGNFDGWNWDEWPKHLELSEYSIGLIDVRRLRAGSPFYAVPWPAKWRVQ